MTSRRLGLRQGLAIVAAALAVTAGAHEAGSVGDGTPPDPRAALLRSGEAALARGATDDAIAAFDRAAMMQHASDTELDLVQAYLQAGDYRRALAFAAHVAGAHSDEPAAAALYAWLLHAGGQGAYAKRVLADALLRHPDDTVLSAANTQLARALPRADGALLEPPHRFAPLPLLRRGEPAVDADARAVASGVLVDGGRRAIVPLAALDAARRVWVRNGLGETTRAELEHRFETLGLALLRLTAALDGSAEPPAPAPRDPFAGSPALVLDYVPASTPAWPQMSIGFLGPQAPSARSLGIDVPGSELGGPVFDGAGRWIGIALRSAGGTPALVPLSALRSAWPERPASASAPPPAAPADLIYERGLRAALQLIVAR